MKLQRSTIILMFGALLMGGAFYYYETLIIPAQEDREAFTRKLFKFQKEDVRSLLVKTESKTLRFERVSEISAPTDLWFMEILEVAKEPAATEKTTTETATEETSPETVTSEETATETTTEEIVTSEETATETATEETSPETVTSEETATEETSPETVTSEKTTTEENQNNITSDRVPDKSTEKTYANEAYVSFLIEQLVSDRSEQNFTVPSEQLKEYGLKPPIATIEITLKDGKTHKLIIGKSEFSGNYIYGQVNPPSPEMPNQQVVVVSKNFEYGVDRTIEDWKQPEEILEETTEEPAGDPSEDKTQNNTLEETTETIEEKDPVNTETTDDSTDPDVSESAPDSSEANPEITEPETLQ